METEGVLSNADGTVVVSISRNTGNIIAAKTVNDINGNPLYTAGQVVKLPFVVFGYNDYRANYGQSLKQALLLLQQAVPGIQLTIGTSNNSVTFTYTATLAGTIDVVTIYYPGSDVTNYLNMMSSTVQTKGSWHARYLNYVISDPNGAAQFTALNALIQSIEIGSKGVTVTSEVLLNGCVMPQDNKADRVGIQLNEHVTAQKGFLDAIIAPPAASPFIVTYYISKVNHAE